MEREMGCTGALVLVLVLVLVCGCLPAQDPETEARRNACHVEANVLAERTWAKECPGLEWRDCEGADSITADLERELAECDKKGGSSDGSR